MKSNLNRSFLKNIQRGNWKEVERLYKAGANPLARFLNQRLVHLLADSNQWGLIKQMPQKAMLIPNSRGVTPLHQFCAQMTNIKDPAIVAWWEALTKDSFPWNLRDKFGSTPLHHVFQSGTGTHIESVITTLMARGANPQLKNWDRKTPLDCGAFRLSAEYWIKCYQLGLPTTLKFDSLPPSYKKMLYRQKKLNKARNKNLQTVEDLSFESSLELL